MTDARAAQASRDFDRAYGAATVVIDNASLLEASTAEQEEATSIRAEAARVLADGRLEKARPLPRGEGLGRRFGLLHPVLADPSLDAFHERARTMISDDLLALWERGAPELTKESYAQALAALQRHEAYFPKIHAIRARIEEARARMAKEHEARAAEAPVGETGLALRRYHLAKASALGAGHDATVAQLDRELQGALGVAYVIAKMDVAAGCEAHRGAVTGALASTGKHEIALTVRVGGCNVSRDLRTQTQTRRYQVPVLKRRLAEVAVDTYYSQTTKEVTDRYCWGSASAGGETCSTTIKTTTRPIRERHFELRQIEEVVQEDREAKYPVRTKTKRARFQLSVVATIDGESKVYETQGEDDFNDVEVSGDSGDEGRAFRAEPSDGEMLGRARAEAIDRAVDFVQRLGTKRLAVALDTYQAEAAGDALKEEAAHAAVVWALQAGPRYDESRAWLDARWGGQPPAGQMAVAVNAFKAPLEPVPFGDYPHEPPVRPDYLNVAHGAAYLVTRGLSFDATARQSSLLASRSHVAAGASYTFGNGTHGVRLAGAASSTSVAGDAFGYAFGASYARSLRGSTNERHRLALVASVGLSAGETRLDGPVAGSAAKERFLRVPIALTASVPLYYVALHATVSFEPNVFALSRDDGGFRAIHPASGWLGVTPLPWLVVEGGAELPFGAADVAPRLGGRLGLRL